MSAVDLERLLAATTPFLDVRAPAEFQRGSVPGAVNLPLLDDEQRHRVGITYKQRGHDAALALGHDLVSGSLRESRERTWREFAEQHPDAWIYCWRGGERSTIVQSWLAAAGVSLPRVPGGFKALRRTCLDVLERAPRERAWIVLGGRTGSGKTELLASLPNAIDLEGLARHRGSAFGAWDTPQPAPVSFENALACAWLQHPASTTLVVEDESRTIGRLALPEAWHTHMQTVGLALLDVPIAERVSNIEREYVAEPLRRGVPADTLLARYRDALRRIERRLGGARRQTVEAALERAFAGAEHRAWIEPLLTWYYDPMYDHQLSSKRLRIAVQGCPDRVREYLLSEEVRATPATPRR
ncbi:MAG: tRNA 2-selenouridine(34) synthase MnmH [Pseudomonadales bacterium]